MDGVFVVRRRHGQFNAGFQLTDAFAEHPELGRIRAAAPGRDQDQVAGQIGKELELAPEETDQWGRGAFDLLREAGGGLAGADRDGVLLDHAVHGLGERGRGGELLRLGLSGAVDGGLCHARNLLRRHRAAASLTLVCAPNCHNRQWNYYTRYDTQWLTCLTSLTPR